MEEEEHQKKGKKANKGRKKNKKTPTIQGWCRCWKWWQAIVIPELINDINFIICSNCCKWRWRRLTVEELVYENEEEATQRAWIGCDRTGCWRWYHYWYAGFSRKPRRNTVYVKSAHLDTAAMQQYTYILKLLKYSLTIVLLIFTSHILTHSLTCSCHFTVTYHSLDSWHCCCQNFFEPPPICVATSEWFFLTYTTIFLPLSSTCALHFWKFRSYPAHYITTFREL